MNCICIFIYRLTYVVVYFKQIFNNVVPRYFFHTSSLLFCHPASFFLHFSPFLSLISTPPCANPQIRKKVTCSLSHETLSSKSLHVAFPQSNSRKQGYSLGRSGGPQQRGEQQWTCDLIMEMGVISSWQFSVVIVDDYTEQMNITLFSDLRVPLHYFLQHLK